MKSILCLALALPLAAQQRPINPIPPPGLSTPDTTMALTAAIDKIKDHPLASDVIVFRDAVRFASIHGEYFAPEEIERGRTLLKHGMDRAEALARGEAPWASATGLVARGYKSKIDDSIQPYGLVIPPTWSANSPRKWRLDLWFHGRAEKLSEVNFLHERMTRPGEFTPPDAIVLHLYGRYCNANKFAGEVDLFEAIEEVKKRYRIDENRIVARGFSMGGASTWQFATHFPGVFAAAAPGAGFAESAEFLQVFQRETVKPTWYEQKLWRMYDATEYALNLFNLPVVAYSGEVDRQKQAADIMAKYMEKEGLRLTHIIGPNTPHRYHPDSKIEINRRLDAIAERGRDPYPREIKFITYTLAYNKVKWIEVDAMTRHWEAARIEAEAGDPHSIRVKTSGVEAFTINYGPGGAPLLPGNVTLLVDGAKISAPGPMSDRSFTAHLRKTGTAWKVTPDRAVAGVQKTSGLQGPIDDAFMNRFIFVTPTGSTASNAFTERIAAEQARAIKEWRRQFRGDAIVRKDTEITDAEIASANLVLWGDPTSNQVMARVMEKLPVKWTRESVTVGAKSYPAASHYPAMIYPNPLNPKRYVVLNSGFTFREYDYLNNARQIPKLPDWAVVDVAQPADARWPGRIADAGFFGEKWELQAAGK